MNPPSPVGGIATSSGALKRIKTGSRGFLLRPEAGSFADVDGS
jgi:hypothetical protein